MTKGYVNFYYRGVEYSGDWRDSETVFDACLQVLASEGVSYADKDSVEVVYYKKPKQFVVLGSPV